MSTFRESEDGIDYSESLSPLVRALILLMALAMFAGAAFFLVLVPWHEPTWTLLVAALFVLAPAALGAFFVYMGVVPAKHAFFDARTRKLRLKLRGPLGRRERELPFEAIESLALHRNKGLDDPDTFSLHLKLVGRKRPHPLGIFGLEEEALAWQARLQSLLSTPAPGKD